MNRILQGGVLALLFTLTGYASTWEGTSSLWNGYERHVFKVDGRTAWVTIPKKAKPGKPWVWRAQFPGHYTDVDEILLERGFHTAFIDCGNAFGAPPALRSWDAFYQMLTQKHGLSPKVCLEAVSRGGLYSYRWASQNPEAVTCIFASVPVCDFKSWPMGDTPGKERLWKSLLEQYGLTQEEALAYSGNPIDVLGPLATANIPLLHLVTLHDKIVPPGENTFVLAERYRKLGGSIEIIALEEGASADHHQYEVPDPKHIADFIETKVR